MSPKFAETLGTTDFRVTFLQVESLKWFESKSVNSTSLNDTDKDFQNVYPLMKNNYLLSSYTHSMHVQKLQFYTKIVHPTESFLRKPFLLWWILLAGKKTAKFLLSSRISKTQFFAADAVVILKRPLYATWCKLRWLSSHKQTNKQTSRADNANM